MVDHVASYSNPFESFSSLCGQVVIELTFRSTPLYQNPAYLYKHYVEDGLSARQLARQIGCRHSVINEALNSFGIIKGYRPSGRPKYGFKFACDGKRVPDESQMQVIDAIEQYRYQGRSFGKISAILNKQSVKSPNGFSYWHPSVVMRALGR
jgi:hypothetical protein